MISELKPRDFAGGSDGLGQRFGGVGLVEEHLTLKVTGLDVVAVDDAQVANSGAGEQAGQRRSGGAASDDGDARSGKPLLAFRPNGLKEDLARIAFGEFQ